MNVFPVEKWGCHSSHRYVIVYQRVVGGYGRSLLCVFFPEISLSPTLCPHFLSGKLPPIKKESYTGLGRF